MARAKVTSKGQITIPKSVRERLGLHAGDEVEFVEERDGVRVQKILAESPFTKYLGYLTGLVGRDPDDLVREMRGE